MSTHTRAKTTTVATIPKKGALEKAKALPTATLTAAEGSETGQPALQGSELTDASGTPSGVETIADVQPVDPHGGVAVASAATAAGVQRTDETNPERMTVTNPNAPVGDSQRGVGATAPSSLKPPGNGRGQPTRPQHPLGASTTTRRVGGDTDPFRSSSSRQDQLDWVLPRQRVE